MPRAKSDNAKTSAELDAEIKEMQEKIAAKRKAMAAAKKQEDAEARRARELAEREFNRRFVELAKTLRLDNGHTVFEIIKHLLENPNGTEAEPVDQAKQRDETPGMMQQVS